MKKRGMIGHMAAVAVVLSLISTSLLSGTLAKYTTSVTVQDTAKVANFAFTMTDKVADGLAQNEDSTTTATFKLFETSDTAVADGTADQKLIAPGTNGTFNFEFKNSSDVAVDDTYKITLTGDELGGPISGMNQIPLVIKFNEKYFSDFFWEEHKDTDVVIRPGTGTVDETTQVRITGPISGSDKDEDWVSLAKEVSDLKTGYQQKVNTTEQAFTYAFEWSWAFEGADKAASTVEARKQSDKSDTVLGTDTTRLEPKLQITLTTTQLDNFAVSATTVPSS